MPQPFTEQCHSAATAKQPATTFRTLLKGRAALSLALETAWDNLATAGSEGHLFRERPPSPSVR